MTLNVVHDTSSHFAHRCLPFSDLFTSQGATIGDESFANPIKPTQRFTALFGSDLTEEYVYAVVYLIVFLSFFLFFFFFCFFGGGEGREKARLCAWIYT